jgi:hypothetical protein
MLAPLASFLLTCYLYGRSKFNIEAKGCRKNNEGKQSSTTRNWRGRLVRSDDEWRIALNCQEVSYCWPSKATMCRTPTSIGLKRYIIFETTLVHFIIPKDDVVLTVQSSNKRDRLTLFCFEKTHLPVYLIDAFGMLAPTWSTASKYLFCTASY